MNYQLQEVTITQRSSSSSSSKPSTPVPSPVQKSSGISLSAITVPKAKAQSIAANHSSSKQKQPQQQQQQSALDTSVDLRTNSATSADDFSKPEVIARKYSELFTNYQELKRAFAKEQTQNNVLQRQITQLQSNFEMYKRQQQQKFDSILFLLQTASAAVSGNAGNGGDGRKMSDDDVL